jgi:hypothetical protein
VGVYMRMRACSFAYVVCNMYASFVAPLASPHFLTLSLKMRDFWKKVIEHKRHALIFSTNVI